MNKKFVEFVKSIFGSESLPSMPSERSSMRASFLFELFKWEKIPEKPLTPQDPAGLLSASKEAEKPLTKDTPQ